LYEFFNFSPIEIGKAKKFLLDWCADVKQTIFESYKSTASYVERHTEVLLNIIRERRSSSISEGINRKVTVLKSMAYGYRCIHYFKLKIL
jgi:transposase